MDATLACGIGVMLAGPVSAYLVAQGASQAFLRRHRSASVVSEVAAQRAAWLLRNGCRPREGVAERLLCVPAVAEAAREAVIALAARGFAAGERSLVSLLAALVLAAFLGCSLIARSPWAPAWWRVWCPHVAASAKGEEARWWTRCRHLCVR